MILKKAGLKTGKNERSKGGRKNEYIGLDNGDHLLNSNGNCNFEQKELILKYLKYFRYLTKYQLCEVLYNELLIQEEELFQKTQPKATDFGKEKVSGNCDEDPFADYVIAKEQKRLDEAITKAKKILDRRGELLKEAERELYSSTEIDDKIYRLNFLQGFSARNIAAVLPISKRTVYRKLDEIQKNLKETK